MLAARPRGLLVENGLTILILSVEPGGAAASSGLATFEPRSETGPDKDLVELDM